MKRKTTLVDLLDAMYNRQGALLMMQVEIEDGDFQYAMENHFEYLYWGDEVTRMWEEHEAEYWDLIWAARLKEQP